MYIYYNTEAASKTINLGANKYCDVDNNTLEGTFTLQPYSSKILLSCFNNNDGYCNNKETSTTAPGEGCALSKSDTTAPTGAISINSGASYTNSTTVSLSLSSTDTTGVTGYYLSTSNTTPSAGSTGWVAVTSSTSYLATVSYTLSAGDGVKALYCWYKDSAGNISTSSNDSITLDTTVPASQSSSSSSSSVSQSFSSTSGGGGGGGVFTSSVSYESTLKPLASSTKQSATAATTTDTASESVSRPVVQIFHPRPEVRPKTTPTFPSSKIS